MFSWDGFGEKHLDFISKPLLEHKRITILSGAIRSGKTTAMIPKGILEWLGTNTNPNLKKLPHKAIVGVSKDTVYENVLVDWFDFFEETGTPYSYNSTTGTLKVKYNAYDTAVCKVIGAGKNGSEKKIRGKTFGGAYFDELTLINFNFFKEMLGRCSIANSKIFATTNPDSPNHWVYTDYMNGNEDVETYHFTIDDNNTLSDEYKDFIKRQYKGTFYARFIEGQWVIAEGLVYNTFKPDSHILSHNDLLEKIKNFEMVDFFFGVDWGSTHPTAVALFAMDNKGIYYLLDEFYKTDVDHIEVKRWLEEKQAEYGILCNWKHNYFRFGNCDNARPEQNKYLKSNWVIYAEKPSVCDSIAIVRELINFDRFFMSDRCVQAKNSFLTYRYPDKNDNPNKGSDNDNPLKINDDMPDAIRYGLFTHVTRFGIAYRKKTL